MEPNSGLHDHGLVVEKLNLAGRGGRLASKKGPKTTHDFVSPSFIAAENVRKHNVQEIF